jgi:hypothetical protein
MQRRGLVNLVLAGSACGIRPLAPLPRYRQGLRGLLPRNNALLRMLALGGVWPAVATAPAPPWFSTPLSTESQPAEC